MGDTRDGGAITGNLQSVPTTFGARTVEHLQFEIIVSRAPSVSRLSFGLAVNQVNGANGNCDGMYGTTTTFAVHARR